MVFVVYFRFYEIGLSENWLKRPRGSFRIQRLAGGDLFSWVVQTSTQIISHRYRADEEHVIGPAHCTPGNAPKHDPAITS